MISHRILRLNAQTVGIACVLAATALGLFYLHSAGAPTRYLAINAGACVVGIALLAIAARSRVQSTVILPAMSIALLATAWFGVTADGATRWIKAGPIVIEPSLVLLPFMAVAFARSRGALATLGIAVAGVALALQPDRAMAGALLAAVAALAVAKRDRWALLALAAAAIAFAITVYRPDSVPPAPYVEQILYTAFDVGPLTGLAVLAGSALLVVPGVNGARRGASHREAYAAFGAVWVAIIAAAALGNYPTPVVGYGASAILGYLLGLAALPRAGNAGDESRMAR